MKTLVEEIDDELSAWPKTSSLVRCLTRCKHELEQYSKHTFTQGEINLALMERVMQLESQIKNQ